MVSSDLDGATTEKWTFKEEHIVYCCLIVHACTTPVKMEIVATLCELGTIAHTHCSRVDGKCVAINGHIV